MSAPIIPKDLSEKLENAYAEWAKDPENHSSGYAYESSFARMWEALGKEIFRESVGEAPRDKNLKKNSRPGSGR